jgi:hypothetical protein
MLQLSPAASGHLVYECNVSTGDMVWGDRLEQLLGYSVDEMLERADQKISAEKI